MKKIVILVMVVVALIYLASPRATNAQTSSGTVVGVVSDSSGAVIPDVTVILSNPSKGTEYTAVTNSVGSYRITNIPPGPGYRLVFKREGFSDFQVDNIYVNVANISTQNARMVPGQQIKVTVNAGEGGATLNTEDATIGNNVQVSKLNDLPVQSRLSPSALFTLQPGITLSGAATGARTDQDNVTVDGLDVNDFATGNFGAITGNAPVDAMQEFRGTTAGFTATSGQGGGGQFQLITRSGTNHWHGMLSEYHRDNSTTANDWFNDQVGLRAPKLVRNQFGGNLGGPIKRDKAFFFFDYQASRIAQDASILRTVPLKSYTDGNVSYINDSNNNGCSDTSRQNTAPSCISQLTPDQVMALDPAGIGESPAYLKLLSLYPAANDPTTGDGVNTGGFRFNSPIPSNVTTYTGSVDYSLTDKIKLRGVGSFTRENQVNGSGGAAQFPGLPPTVQFVDRSYRYVGFMNWQISPNKMNQFSYGTVVQDYGFPKPQNPLGVNQIGLSSGIVTLMDTPYASPSNSQSRRVPIPQIQDNFSWDKGQHSLSIGGTFKWIHDTSNTVLDYNSYTIGLGSQINSLTPDLRPSDIRTGPVDDPTAPNTDRTFDSAYVAMLGRVAALNATINYDATGAALAQGTGSKRAYQYYQTLVYVADSWKVTPYLTLTYGLNYQYYSVPYETSGLETVSTTKFNDYIAARVAQSAAGKSGPDVLPFITYTLGGPVNHGHQIYNSDHKDFGPRVAFAWNPKFDQKSVFNGSFGIVYDRTIVDAVQYQQDQYSYLFQLPDNQVYTADTPREALLSNPRYDAPPALNPPAPPTSPYTPFVDANGIPGGLINGGDFNEMIDPTLKTPYSMLINFGFQHQFAGSTFLKVNYVGRLGRRLLAQADANQVIDFPDLASGQLLSQAFANVTKELRAGADPANLPAEPWFENQLPANFGTRNGVANNTSVVGYFFNSLAYNGDFADTVQALSRFMDYNIGMGSQFSENSFYTNEGFSSYNGLLVTVQKNLSHGLEFTGNYTWSHSIDNTSLIANSPAIGGYGFVCDVLRPRLCRGNSDFDTTHYLTGYFTYSLPFGRGRTFGTNIPWGLDEIIGGWDLSGITTWHSGTAYSTVSSAFVAGYANNAPALFNGDVGALKHNVHKDAARDGQLNLYADPDAAVGSFQGPIGFQIGSRNSLRGPQYFDLDTGLQKSFVVVPEWGVRVQFRADAFNVLNHPNFSSPGTNTSYDDITQPGNFGQLTSMNGGARVLQLSARMQF